VIVEWRVTEACSYISRKECLVTAFKVREEFGSQKSRVVLIKKPLDRFQFREDALDVATLRAGPPR
jgi:hypothetical protein